MIICIIILSVFIISTILFIIGNKSENDTIFGISMALFLLSTVGIAVSSGLMIANRSPRLVQKEIDKLEMERTMLVYRLDEQQEIGNEFLYEDILEFNKKIYNYKVDRNNPWINWFVDPSLTKIEMIDYRTNITIDEEDLDRLYDKFLVLYKCLKEAMPEINLEEITVEE